MCLSTCASWPIIFQWRKYIFYWNSNIFWQILYVWTMCIIYCLLFILQACSDKWLCNSRRKDTLLMMTKLFAGSASLSRRLLNSGHLLHFLCCTICTMHLLQIFRPKLPIIEPQLQLFPFLATDCHHRCSNLSYSLSLLHLCNYTCKYHHQMQEWINRQIVFKMKLFDVIGFCTWWKSWWCHWWWWCQVQITLPAASSIIERWGVVVVRPRVRSTPRGPNRCTTNCAMLQNVQCTMCNITKLLHT